MLDLREFGTRERIYGDQVQPYTAPSEASRQAQLNVNTQFSKNLKEQQKLNSINERLNNKSQFDQSSVDGRTNASASEADRQQSLLKQAEESEKQDKTFATIPEGDNEEGEEVIVNTKLYDMKQYKYKGRFNSKIYSTCPVLPRFHATFGEPVEH